MLFKKKGLFPKKARLSDEMSLQITSMADIFTILLVFLLKSYASTSVAPSQGVTLPSTLAGQASELTEEALKIEVAGNSVLVEGEAVAPLTGGKFAPSDVQGSVSDKIVSSLKVKRERQILIAKENPNVKVDSKVILLSDKKVPYSTLKIVLASAASQGYTDFKLAVVKPD